MSQPPLKTEPTKVSKEVLQAFKGMTDSESVNFQLAEWVSGNSMHNPVRDECCPDFSCCGGDKMDKDVRIKFSNAVKMNDHDTQMAILGMALSSLTASKDLPNIHIAGEDTTLH